MASPLRIAMLGMIEGNGHPYSWSSIINSFDPAALAKCPYPAILGYLGSRDPAMVGIEGAKVTHVWTDHSADAPLVAATARIPHVVTRPEDVIGHVDGVIIATDDGLDHVRRARPFVEAGLPVFVDKPLATSLPELRTFVAWERAGARIISSSGMRYAVEYDGLREQLPALGELRWASAITIKTWERYGIHLLEPLFCLLGPGFASVRLERDGRVELAHLHHRSGAQLTVAVLHDGGPAFGTLHLCGTKAHVQVQFRDTYTAFRRQLVTFIEYLRTGRPPHAFNDTVEMMAVLIAGLRSRDEGSRRVDVAEILSAS
jgi:predicted dehydrogenase